MTPSGDLQKFEIAGLKKRSSIHQSKSWVMLDKQKSDTNIMDKTQLTFGDRSMTESFVTYNDMYKTKNLLNQAVESTP